MSGAEPTGGVMTKKAANKGAKKSPARKPTKKKATVPKSAKALGALAKSAERAAQRNREKGLAAIALIERRLISITESFYDIGLALQTLQRREVYSAVGASSFEELVESRLSIPRSTAWELSRVPLHFSREAAILLTQDKASAIIRYVRATPEDDSADAIALGREMIDGKRAAELTAAEIKAAAREASPHERKMSPEEEQAQDAAAEVERALEEASGADVTVRAVHRRDDWRATIELPMAIARRLTFRRR